jgi:hypothetical protein
MFRNNLFHPLQDGIEFNTQSLAIVESMISGHNHYGTLARTDRALRTIMTQWGALECSSGKMMLNREDDLSSARQNASHRVTK